MKELGVGLVYFQGFENFLASHSSLIDVIEIEPQTFWYDKNDECDAFTYDRAVTDFLRSYDRPKLFHGVGFPVGGTYLPPERHFNTLRQQAEELKPEWISEHLSFNIFNDAGRNVNAGFLLPPIQTEQGVKTAVRNIRHYQSAMNRSFAFETGVNYLQPVKGEIPDGLFVRRIAEEADCHILLDLHNILTNQRNGRQSVSEFLECLPFERVIELHVGGGIYYKDYYLDAHSGPSDHELLNILEEVVGKLPNLKALMFEITPDYFMKVPESDIVSQLEKMQRIWDKRGKHYKKKESGTAVTTTQNPYENLPVSEWEYTLGNLVLGKDPGNELSEKLLQDKGIEITRDLIFNFRGSILISMMKLSTRLLRLSVGEELFHIYINDFFNSASPELFPVIVAEQFVAYIDADQLHIPYLDKVMEYELASIRTAIDKKNREVSFDFDPMPVFYALKNIMLPARQSPGKTVNLQVVFDQPAGQNEALNFPPVVHN